MPTYAPSFTPRYRAHYIAAGVSHTIQIRAARDTSVASTITNGTDCLFAVFDALAGDLADDFAWVSAEVADQDTDVFTPAAVPAAVTGTNDWVGDSWSAKKRCSFIHVSGRAAGSRTSVMIFGLDIDSDFAVNTGGDGIITTAELGGLADVVTALNAHAHAGSGATALFYARATHKVHDRLLKLVRRGLISSAALV